MDIVAQITALAERVAAQFLALSDMFIPEAPQDGQAYVRKDGEWVTLDSVLNPPA